jgi:hypothetical protein
MRKLCVVGTIVCLLAGCLLTNGAPSAAAGEKDEAKIAHMVFFALKDNSAIAKGKLVEACKKYLTKHPGEVGFHVGTRATGFTRSVNDVNFDVALTIIFENRGAHDTYDASPQHKQFIDENRANWKAVRVFDSVVVK